MRGWLISMPMTSSKRSARARVWQLGQQPVQNRGWFQAGIAVVIDGQAIERLRIGPGCWAAHGLSLTAAGSIGVRILVLYERKTGPAGGRPRPQRLGRPSKQVEFGNSRGRGSGMGIVPRQRFVATAVAALLVLGAALLLYDL